MRAFNDVCGRGFGGVVMIIRGRVYANERGGVMLMRGRGYVN